MFKEKTFIIAEVGSNHKGSVDLAKEHIDSAKDCGADAVKFQSLNIGELYKNPEEKIQNLHKKIDFEEKWHYELNNYCKKKGIKFCSSPTYLKAIEILESIDISFYKIASAQVGTFPQLIEKVAKTGKTTILSTGIASYAKLNTAIDIFHANGNDKFAIMHCNSKYPTPSTEVNLGRMNIYHEMFKCPVGFSDHTLGSCVAIAAVAKGANIIEKHFKLSNDIETPDSPISLNAREFKELVSSIRKVEEACITKPRIQIDEDEMEFNNQIRYKLIANQDISEHAIETPVW